MGDGGKLARDDYHKQISTLEWQIMYMIVHNNKVKHKLKRENNADPSSDLQTRQSRQRQVSQWDTIMSLTLDELLVLGTSFQLHKITSEPLSVVLTVPLTTVMEFKTCQICGKEKLNTSNFAAVLVFCWFRIQFVRRWGFRLDHPCLRCIEC